ncbi:MAG TPA: UPF0182 family protein [Mycobacteriales bacterium]|nr:UPF0182 family protein [Mycobacteriales bacterium]
MRPSLPVPSLSRRAKIIIGVVVLLVLVLSVLGSLVRLYVDWLWFGEVGFRQVFSTGLRTRLLLFFLFGVLMALVIAVNLFLAYRFRPPFRPMSLEQQNLERYRSALEPRRRLIVIGVSAVLGIFTGITAQAQWQTWLQWRNGTPFNVLDPQFGKDISYYTFTYPFQRFVLGLLFTAVVLSLLAALAVHYLFGGVRLQTPGEKVTPAARVHLSVLLGIFVLLKAAAYYLDRYGLLFNERDGRTGASYTDVNAVLPAKTILMFVALICAVAILANIFLRWVQLPAIAIVLLLLTSIVASGIYPAVVQQFSVRPNANEKEAEYIGRNIEATRTAYGIESKAEGGKVNQQQYNANTDVTSARNALISDKSTIPNARLLDPNILSPTFRQFQQIRNVYDFPEKLDIDRYTIAGKKSDYVVAARELSSDNLTGNQTNWINKHTFYTHGNGFVAAAANENLTSQAGFTVGGLPATGPIKISQPRIYYGELITDYSIVDTNSRGEFDRPGGSGEDELFKYDGSGGVDVGSFFHRLAFAINYRERNILLSSAINGESKILFVRDPADRVEKAAPFLKIDGDPYPAVVDGQIEWIVDGYTTLNNYPYSERQTLGEVAADSRTGQGTRALPRQDVNYIRNSVKATVNAYTGKVTLYAFDEADPVLKTWMKAYPGIIQQKSEISPQLQEHLRYPEDLFKVQRELLTRYHVTDPRQFFNTQDFWRVPADPTTGQGAAQPPYYIVAQAPGQEAPVFQLTSALNALSRDNLAAYVTVSSDPDDYGEMQVLELPGSQAVLGPGQVQGRFGSQSEIAQTITLLNSQGSQVRYGNLLTLPVGGGLLYIEPLYVEAAGLPYPILQRVLVAFGDRVAFASSLTGALDSLFGAGAGSQAPDNNGTSTPTPTPTPSGSSPPSSSPSSPAPPSGSGGGAISPALNAALTQLSTAYTALQNAYRSGDVTAIGQAQTAVNQAAAAVAAARGGG